MREFVRVSKALSDENRLRMLKLLMEKDICVCEMQEILSISHSQVSRNLKTLMDAGFLKRWHDGKCVVYEADRTNSNKHCKVLIDVLADSFNYNEGVLRDREKLQEVIAAQVREKKK
ncbi:ArsR/SmtB family transcription factor [Chloroflexota bacterium]